MVDRIDGREVQLEEEWYKKPVARAVSSRFVVTTVRRDGATKMVGMNSDETLYDGRNEIAENATAGEGKVGRCRLRTTVCFVSPKDSKIRCTKSNPYRL